MIGSVGSSYSAVASTRAPVVRSSGSAFASAMATASSSDPGGDQVSISPAALAVSRKASTSMATLRNPQLAAEADTISAAQGQPSGKYDFSSMTGKQLNTVVDDMVQNGEGNNSALDGLRMLALFAQMSMGSGTPDHAHNVRAELEQGMSFAQSTGNTTNYRFWAQSLDFVNTIGGSKSA